LERWGFVIANENVFPEVASGRALDDRPQFHAACARARELDGILVAESVDRQLRNADYHSADNKDAQPTDEEFEALLALADGVPLSSIIDPDATLRQVTGIKTRWRGEATGQKGGRPRKGAPRKKRTYSLKFPSLARQMSEADATLGEIAKELGVPRSTVQGWVPPCKGGASKTRRTDRGGISPGEKG
jgi:hypothetical protein